jgi:MFS family permease
MGVLTACDSIPYLLIGIFLGALVDRASRKRLLVASALGGMFVLFSAGALTFYGYMTIKFMWAVACLIGTFTLLSESALGAFIPEILPRHQWLGANSRLTATQALSEIVGPGLAGYLLQVVTTPAVMLIDCCTYGLSALCISSVRRTSTLGLSDDQHISEPKYSVWTSIRQGTKFVFTEPALRIFAVWSSVWNCSWNAVLAVYVLYATRTLGLRPAAIGMIFAAGGGVLVLGAHGIHSVLLASIAMFLFNLGESGYVVNMLTFRQEVTPTKLMGRMDLTMKLCFRGMYSLGAIVGGAIGSKEGLWTAMVVGTCGLFITVVGLHTSGLNRVLMGRQTNLPQDRSASDSYSSD